MKCSGDRESLLLMFLFRDGMPSLSLQYFWTCSRVLVTFSMLCTETSKSSKKLIYLDLSGRFSKR